MNLNELGTKAFDTAITKGFYEDYNYLQVKLAGDERALKFFHELWLSARLMLLVSELSEALEAVRKGNYSCKPNTGGFGEELADVQIRLSDLTTHSLNSSFETTVIHKMAYNATRMHKHGKNL